MAGTKPHQGAGSQPLRWRLPRRGPCVTVLTVTPPGFPGPDCPPEKENPNSPALEGFQQHRGHRAPARALTAPSQRREGDSLPELGRHPKQPPTVTPRFTARGLSLRPDSKGHLTGRLAAWTPAAVLGRRTHIPTALSNFPDLRGRRHPLRHVQ